MSSPSSRATAPQAVQGASAAQIHGLGESKDDPLWAVVVDFQILSCLLTDKSNINIADVYCRSILDVCGEWGRMRKEKKRATINGIALPCDCFDKSMHFSDVIRFLNPDVLVFCWAGSPAACLDKLQHFVVTWHKILREAYICGRGYNSTQPVLLISRQERRKPF